MWTTARVCIAAVAVSVLVATLGGCNDDGSDAQSSTSSASNSNSSGAGPAPAISGTPSQAVVAGMAYEFRPTVSTTDGVALHFVVANLPAWAAFNSATGVLSGTPKASDVRVYANISIKVSSGDTNAALTPFSIRVLAPTPDAPAISGTPANSVVAGAAYNFQPTATSADGAALSYAVSNLPSWANFNTSTGALTGTPAATDGGTYAHIVITVSNASGSASLAPFSIAVSSGSSAVATVTWTAPAASAPAEVVGYRVYYGTSAAGMTHFVSVSDPTSTSYVIDNLSAGTWFFAVASYGADDVQSPLSPMVSVSL